MSDGARCALCGSPAPPRFQVREYVIYRCASCDLEFVWPTPAPEVIAKVYAQSYFTGSGAGYQDYFGRERSLSQRKAAERLKALAELGMTGGKILDFGCAAGFFVEAAHACGWNSFGVEPSDEARRATPEAVRARVFDRLEAVRSQAPFDVITLWDVLEHLPAPVETLRSLRSLLRAGGMLGVVVPVIGNINTLFVPRTWDQYKPPEHLWYFSRQAVRSALLVACGATVVREDVAWQRSSRLVDPEGVSKNPLVRALRPLDSAFHRALAVVVSPDLIVDSVAFYARV